MESSDNKKDNVLSCKTHLLRDLATLKDILFIATNRNEITLKRMLQDLIPKVELLSQQNEIDYPAYESIRGPITSLLATVNTIWPNEVIGGARSRRSLKRKSLRELKKRDKLQLAKKETKRETKLKNVLPTPAATILRKKQTQT